MIRRAAPLLAAAPPADRLRFPAAARIVPSHPLMLIRLGYDIRFDIQAPVPMVALLNVIRRGCKTCARRTG